MKAWELKRRALISVFAKCSVALNLMSLLKTIGALAADDATGEVRLVIRSTDEDQVREIVSRAGGVANPGASKYVPLPGERSDGNDPGFAPLVVLVCVFSAAYLAKTMFELWDGQKYGGLIVDARGTGMVVKETHSIPRGTVIVLGPEIGKVQQFTPKDPAELTGILDLIKASMLSRVGRSPGPTSAPQVPNASGSK